MKRGHTSVALFLFLANGHVFDFFSFQNERYDIIPRRRLKKIKKCFCIISKNVKNLYAYLTRTTL